MNVQVRIAPFQSLRLVEGGKEPLTNYHFVRVIIEERQKPQLCEQNANKRAEIDLVLGSIKAVFCEVDALLK